MDNQFRDKNTATNASGSAGQAVPINGPNGAPAFTPGVDNPVNFFPAQPAAAPSQPVMPQPPTPSMPVAQTEPLPVRPAPIVPTQPTTPRPIAQTITRAPAQQVTAPSALPPEPPAPLPPQRPSSYKPVRPQAGRVFGRRLKIVGAIVLLLLIGIGGFIAWNVQPKDGQVASTDYAGNKFNSVQLPLDDFVDSPNAVLGTRSLTINGQLRLNDAVIISPSGQPSNATAGQIYYDRANNLLAYFNGSEFIDLPGELTAGNGVSTAGGTIVNTGVLSLQGQTGAVTFTGGSGIAVDGTTLSNTGVTSFGSTTGDITVGSGLSMDGNTLNSTAVNSLTAGTINLVISDDGAGNLTISDVGGGSGTVQSPGGTAGRIAKFTGVQTIEDSLLSESGATVTVNGSLAVTSSLTLGTALSVGNGGTGATSLANNGVLIGQGAGAVTAAVAGAPGLCLVSTAGAPAFGSCTGGSVVTSLNGLSGALTLANATGAGSTVTINDASTAQKGIAQFNATNFTAAAGVVNTAQNINTTASPTFAGITLTGDLAVNGNDITSTGALNITPAGALTAGSDTQTFTLQGNASSVINATSGVNTTTLAFQTPTADVTYRFATAAAGTYDVCTMVGNCAGVGGGVTTTGGTTGAIAKFTGAQTLGDSLLSEAGAVVTVNGDLNLTSGNQFLINGTQISSADLSNDANLAKLNASQTFTGNTNTFQNGTNSATAFSVQNAAGNRILTLDTSGGEAELGQASTLGGRLAFNNATNANTITLIPAVASANRTITLPDDTGTICLSTGNCAGAGVTLQTAYNNSTNPEITVDATRGALTVRDNATPLGANLLEVQNNAGSTTYFAVSATGTTTTGSSTATGNINSSGGALQTNGTTRIDNGGNATNIGNIGLSGTISGGTTITSSGNINTTGGALQTNSTTRVDNTGNLTNIGNITGTGAVTIASSGAGNDVVINGADEFIVQDAAVFNGQATLNADVDLVLAETENLSITNTVTGTNAVNLISAVLTNNTSSGTQNIALLQNAAGSGTTDGILVLDNADTDTAVAAGLHITSAAGGVTTALDVSDADIVTALLFGTNDITGTNFSVTGSSGSFTSAGNGTIQGGTITVGTASQAGTLVVHDGSSNTGTIAVAALGQNTVYTLPDPGAGTAEICLDTGNCSGAAATLQSAYDNSTNPEIVLDATRGALTLRDNATPIAANLFEVQNNAGSTTYLAVTTSGISVTGSATISGNINSSGGALQTGGTTRIDNTGNATNIGNIGLSGSISGGTTYTGSGNINTTGGSLQTNSTTRVDNTGNLTNIGNITGTGAVTIASSGAGNDVVINGADEFIVQDAAVFNGAASFNGVSTFNTDLDVTLADAENISITNTVTGTTALNLVSAVLTNNTSSGTQNIALLQNAAGSGTTDGLLVLDNADTDTAVGSGIAITSAAGGVTTAIDVSDPDIVTALLFGANDITGTNFSVTGSNGNFTSAGNGTVQGGIITVGTGSQAGTLVVNDGSSNTGTIAVAALGQNTVYTLPDPGSGSATICLSTGNCAGAAVTLQSAYDNSANPEIVLDATRGALTLRDNATPLGANLFEVQNNAGSTTYLAVTTTGLSVTGSVAATGNINSSAGGIQTNGTTRIDNTGNLTNIGNLTLSGAISGGTTYSGSGNINTTGGALQTNSTTRVDNTGNLVNIGNITGTGAISIASTGAGNDITIDGADLFVIQDAAVFNGTATFNTDVDLALADTENLSITSTVTGTNAVNLIGTIMTNNTSSGTQQVGFLQNAAGSGSTEALLVLDNADTDTAVANGLQITSAAGGITAALDVSDGDIVTALLFGTNDITGTNFSVTGSTGSFTSAGNGTIQGGTITVGTASQAGSLVVSDGSSNTGTIQTASLGANRTYTLPDASGTICIDTGNCNSSITLQLAYDNSTNPEIVVDATRGALTVRDNATPIAANLFEVQNNAGSTTYLAVTSSGINVTGSATVSGNINSSGGALQTNGTTRIDNSGNATNIGNLGLSGTISGGTTITGSGNINTTGGSLQTNSTTRVDNTGNLTNIGDITGTGAVTIASSGAGNDVIINGADEFIVQDAAVFNSQATFATDVDLAFADTENLSITTTVTGTNAVNLVSAVLTNNTTSGVQNVALLQNAAGSGTTDGLLVLDNADTDTAVVSGLHITSAAGGVTTALDVSDSDIVTALLFGANDITGTNFSVTGGTGSFTSAGNGTIQGGTITVGTASQVGSLVVHDGSSNTGSVTVAALGQNTVYTLPDPGAGTAEICLDTGNCAGAAVTLQSAYDASTNPEIVLDATRGALTLRDNATPLGANLFEVQNNAGSTTYLAVTTSGISVTGSVAATGNINSSAGALQTNGTTRIDNTGNATNIGNLTLSGAISGGTVYSGSGNINTSGGALQTAGTSRVDNSGNLVNIGNITGTGAVTIASSGAGNDVTINGADQFIVQDAAVFNDTAAFNTDVDLTFADTENLSITNTVTGTNGVNLIGAVLTNNTSSGTQQVALLQNAAGSGTTDGLLVLDNADTDTAVTSGLLMTSAAGGITTAVDVSDPDIVTALLFGANDITGTNFSVTGSSGSFTSAGNATIQGGTVTAGTSSQAGTLVVNDGSSNTGTLGVAALGQNTIYTLPDPGTGSVTICLSTGNCAGSGGGVTGSGTNNRLTKFTSTGSTVGDSTITDNGTTVTTTVDVVIQGGDLTVGTTSQLATLLLHDGNGQTTGLQAGDSSGNLTFILPTTAGTGNQCLKQSGTGNQLIWDACDGGGGGSSATLQNAYNNGNTITTTDARDIDIVLANTTTDSNFDLVVADGSTSFVSFTRANGAGTADPAQMLLVDNLDADRALPIGIKLQSAGGGMTVAIDATDAEIVDAISVAANNIVGTTGNIDFTNFDVVGATGSITTAGDLAVNGGDVTSTGALTLTSAGGGDIVLNSADTIELQDATNVTGALSATGNINSSGGNVQTNSTERIQNDGDLVNIGSLTLSGAISGGTTYSGSGNINTTGGALQTNSTTRVANNGDLQNIGNLTATAAITIASTGAGNDVIIDGGDEFIVQDAAVFNALATFNTDVDFTLADTENVSITNTVTSTNSVNVLSGIITNNTSSGTQRAMLLQNAAGTGTTESLLGLDNADTDTAVVSGIAITSAAGGITTAIDLTDTDIVDAINVAANNIVGTTGNLDFTNFDVTGSSGNVTTAGDVAVNGGDITSTGALNITPSGALVVGATGQTATFQGSVTSITSTGAGNDISLNSADTIELLDSTNVTGNADVSGTLAVGTANAFTVSATGDITGNNATLQGGSVVIGTTSQAGTLALSDGSSNTGLFQVATLSSDRTYTFPNETGTVCLSTGNCAGAGVTLQTAYNNSSDPELTVDATRGALTIRDNASAIGANLLEVQNNAQSTTYFGVSATGVTVTGSAAVTGNINSSGGALQTGGTTRIDNSGNATNIGNIGLSGTISGGTTYTGSGNINTTGGALQTNSTTRVDNSGNLVNIGNITGTGAISIASSGAGNDIIINGADILDIQDATIFASTATFNGAATFNTDVDFALADTENINITNTVTGTNSVDLISGVLTNNTTSGTQRGALLQNGAGTGSTESLLVLDNADTDTALVTGLQITAAAGGITTAIDVSDADIGDAVSVGANNIVGTTGNLDFTNFDVVGSSGNVTAGTYNGQTISSAASLTGTLAVAGNTTLTGDLAVNGGDITSTGALNITPGGTLTVGATGQILSLQGNAGTTLAATDSGNTTTLAFTTPTANTTLNLPALSAGTYTICTTSGNCAGAGVTLQAAYNNSSTPEITVDATRGALTIRDASSAIGANLFEVQNNAQSTTYFAVSATGTSTTGTSTATGNINSSGGALQTNGATRVDNSGNLTNIGSLTLSGAISGGTTYSGSGNINTTGGSIQTNSTERIQNDGDLVNIGNITGAGAITIASSGASNDVTIDGADEFIVQDAAVFNGTATFNTDVDLTLAGSENLSITNTVTGTTSLDMISGVLTNNTTSGTQRGALLQNAAGTGATEALLVLDNADTDTAVTAALQITSAAGAITTAIDLIDADIVDAINVGANNIVGTTGNIDLTNFDVTGSNGNVTAGTYNGQTISSAASFTGTVAVAGNTTLTGDLAVNGGDITSTGALNVTPTGTLTLGSSTQSAKLQGTAALTIEATDGSNTTILGFTTPTADTTINLPALSAGTYTVCTSSGNCAGAGVTLQTAYNNSSDPELTVDATRGALTIRDASSAIGANLLEVQNNAQNTTYFAVSATGTSTTGTSTATGNINSSGGALQTAGTTRIDNSGNASNIGSLTLSGAISGGTTYSGSGNINTTGGTIQTNSTNRIDNSGNLVNIGNITGTGAVTIASAGGGDIIIDGADILDVQDAATFASTATFNGVGTFNTDVDFTLAGTENVAITNTVTGTSALDLLSLTVTNNTTSGTQRGALLENAAGTGVTEALLVLNNADTDTALTAGMIISSAAGNITTAIDLTDAEIGNAISVDANTIAGTTGNIDFTNFDVVGASGNLTMAGVLQLGTLGTADTTTALCRNSSNQIAACNTTGAGVAFVQGGNSFGATAILGTNDANGLSLEVNNNAVVSISATGAVNIANSSDSTQAFNVENATGGNLFTVDTSTSRVGINLGGSSTPSMTGGGMVLNGSLRLIGAAGTDLIDQYTTPGGSNVPAKFSIGRSTGAGDAMPNFSQIIALGLTTHDNDGARGILVADARTNGNHKPTISVLATDESDEFGLTWRGTSNLAYLTTSNRSGNTAGMIVQSGDVTAGANTSGNVGIYSGNGNGTNASSGNVFIDTGTKNGGGTTGVIDIGTGNTSGITIGNAANNSTVAIHSGTGSITIGSGSQSRSIYIGNSVAAQTVVLGSTAGASSMTIRSGTGGLALISEGSNVTVGTSDTTGTLLVLDDKTDSGDPTGVNGGLYYNSSTNKFRCYENSAWVDCISGGTAIDLQDAYDSGNTILTTDARNIAFTLADTATDSNFLVNLQCVTSCSTNGRFAVQSAGSDVFAIAPTGIATFTGTSASATLANFNNDTASYTGTALSVTTNGITTGRTLSLTSTSTGTTSGSLLYLSSATTGAVATNGLVSLNAGGNYTSTSNIGLLSVLANSTAAGTIQNIQGNALTTGSALHISSTSTGTTSGSLLYLTSATTGAVATNGLVSINATGNYTSTSNIGLLSVLANSTAAGTIQNIQGNALTTGNALRVSSTGTGLTSGSLLFLTSATTGAVATNGIVSINATGNYTSTSNIGLLSVLANSTAAGTIQNIQGNALTTGVGLHISSTGTGLTSGSLLYLTSATTGAVATNGIVSLNATGNYTSTSNVGLLNVTANATTAGTVLNLSATGLTTGNGLLVTGGTGTTTGNTISMVNGRANFQPTNTIASAAGATWNGFNIAATTATVTGTTAITTATGFNMVSIGTPTITDSSAVTITNASTMYIASAPTAAGSATITNAYALWIDDGAVRFDGALTVNNAATFQNASDSTTAFRILRSTGSSSTPLFTVDTTNSYVYIGNTTLDTTGALLILDTKTDTGDPSATIAGAMYYNSFMARMRCYFDGKWRTCNEPAGLTWGYNLEEDFLSSNDTLDHVAWGTHYWGEDVTGTGADVTQVDADVASRPGQVQLTTGTTTTGAAGIYLNVTNTEPIFIGGNEEVEFAVNIPNLADGTNDYDLRLGLCDSVATADCTDGVYFEYDRDSTSNQDLWRYATANNSARTKQNSAVAVTAGWTRFKIVVNSAGNSIEFFVNGTSLGTPISANIPTTAARATQPEFAIEKEAGTTARTIKVDYFQIRASLSTAR